MEPSISYNDIGYQRRIALAQKMNEEENWSSDEEEQSKTVGKIKKQTSLDLADEDDKKLTSRVEEFLRKFQKPETKIEESMTVVESMAEENKQVEHVLCQVADKTGIHHNLRGSLITRSKMEENWENIAQKLKEEEEKTWETIAQKLKEEENWSSDEEEQSKTVGKIKKPPRTIPKSIPGDTSNLLQDKVSTSAGKVSEPGSGSQGSSGTLRPVIFFDYEIQEATINLSDSSKIGEGGYGTVYKGSIDDTFVAIKMLSNTATGYQGIKEFHREMGALGLVRHANLVNLVGTCFQLRALVYEYLPNGSLEDCLMERSAELTWEIRTRIVYEICTILMFLHSNQPDPLVHGDLKPRNVLLDVNFKTKLADFGLCRFLTQGEKSHRMKTFHGSTDYIDPDFLESGKVRPAIDVYSFGKTIIRILTGENPTDKIYSKVGEARKTRSLKTVLDPAATDWPEEIVDLIASFALRCRKDARYEAEFMRQFYTDLEMMLDNIEAA